MEAEGRKIRMLFVGPPGAGKGTQAGRVAEVLGIAHVSTGEMFRAIDVESPLGRRVRERIDNGLYVSDDLVVEMIETRVQAPDAAGGYILDGFPRTLGQVGALDAFLGGADLDRVVLLNVGRKELMRRLLARGRKDDVAHTIEIRIRLYADLTQPLVALYRERGILMEVDAAGDIESVTVSILDGLGFPYTEADLAALVGLDLDGHLA